MPPHPTSRRSILMLCSHLGLGLPSGSFPHVSPPKPCIYLTSPSYVLHVPPISFFSIHHRTILGKEYKKIYSGAYKSLARPTSRCILFDGENISFDASFVIYINSTNIPPIIITIRIYETQNLLSL